MPSGKVAAKVGNYCRLTVFFRLFILTKAVKNGFQLIRIFVQRITVLTRKESW